MSYFRVCDLCFWGWVVIFWVLFDAALFCGELECLVVWLFFCFGVLVLFLVMFDCFLFCFVFFGFGV